jgi:hypothetical protein
MARWRNLSGVLTLVPVGHDVSENGFPLLVAVTQGQVNRGRLGRRSEFVRRLMPQTRKVGSDRPAGVVHYANLGLSCQPERD